MKIIIIGCGQIGFSHLRSFINSKNIYEIDVVDNKKRLSDLKKSIGNLKKTSINFRIKIPKNKRFDLAIISTNSLERFKVFKNLVFNNNIKLFIFEKFIFTKVLEFKKFDELYKNYFNKIMVNSFGTYIYRKCGFDKKINKLVNVSVKVKEGTLFTGMIHYFDLFYLLTKKTFKIDFSNIKKLIKSKRLNYKEGNGEIKAENINGKLNICTSKKIDLTIKFEINRQFYSLKLNKNKFYFFKNNNLIKIFPFPLAHMTTEKLFKNKLKHYRNYNYLSKISLEILYSLNKSQNKKIFIT